MARVSARRVRDDRRQRGTVYVEVLACLVPVMTLFLCTVQLAFLGVGRLVVTHAALRGARAAIVLLEDDPQRMGGAPRGDLNASGGSESAAAWTQALAGAASAGLGSSGPASGRSRLQAIREAASAPLGALAPAPRVLLGSAGAITLRESVDGSSAAGSLARFALGVLAYNRGASVVTLRAGPGSEEVVTQVEPRADVTVHVTYLYHCSVPIAARLMCHPAWDLAGYGRALPELQRLDAQRPVESARVMRRLRAEFPDAGRFQEIARELARAESPGMLLPLLVGGGLFKVLQAEATLPNQGAYYYSEGSRAAR